MNPELFEDEDVCEDICGGSEDDDYNALEDEACCGDSTPPGTRTEQPAHLPSIVIDGAHAVADGVANTLSSIQDGANAVAEGVANALSLLQQDGRLSGQLQQMGQGALENVVPKTIPNKENDVHKETQNLGQNILEGVQKLPNGESDGVLRKIKEYKLNLIEQMERERGSSEEGILRKLKEGSTNPDKNLDGTNTNRSSAQKEAQMMMMEALRAIGVLPRPASDNVPTPGATTPVRPSETAPPKPETIPPSHPAAPGAHGERVPVPGATSPGPSAPSEKHRR
ncbi:MAG: hypothetical protein K2W95_19885 [Candidatus Obscuribacterales bacterium]|nr:hypothetical protein [Candidatus Obscuribacterales bacterium]